MTGRTDTHLPRINSLLFTRWASHGLLLTPALLPPCAQAPWWHVEVTRALPFPLYIYVCMCETDPTVCYIVCLNVYIHTRTHISMHIYIDTHIYIYTYTHTYFYAFIHLYIYFSTPAPAGLSALSRCCRLRPESELWVPFASGWVSPRRRDALRRGWVSRGKLNLPPHCQRSAAPSAIREPSPALPFGVNYLLALLMLEGCWWLPAGPSSVSTQAPLISKLVSA